MHARTASAALLALGFADLAVLNLLLAPRLAQRGAGGPASTAIVAESAAPGARTSAQAPAPLAPAPALPALPASASAPPALTAAPAVAAPDIGFDLGEMRVTRIHAAADVLHVASELRADHEKRLLIRGHADRLGSAESNLRLSRQRAEAVMRLLTAFGVPADRVAIEAVGDAEPADSSDTPTGWAHNRRVQLLWR